MNNQNFDNGFSNTIVAIIGTLVRTAERSVVVFWDGLKNTTVHGTPSLLGFVAAIAPVLAPIPIATQTAVSLMKFMDWLPFQAVIMAIVIECAGFVLWVFLTESLMADGWKGTTTQFVFGIAVLVYQVILILINVGLAVNDGTRGTMAFILLLACLFPALCSIAYGYGNKFNKSQLDQEAREAKARAEREQQEQKELEERHYREQKEIDERRYQEKRQDRKEAAALKMQYASDTKQEGLKKQDTKLTYRPPREER